MNVSARYLERYGFTLRSGGAPGADQAFESGIKDPKNKEIYYATDATPAAEAIAKSVHPNWSACSPMARKLHARNVFQCLGRDLKTPSEFTVCWTEGGKLIGGTRTAIVVSLMYDIPVYNLGKGEDAVALFDEFLWNLQER